MNGIFNSFHPDESSKREFHYSNEESGNNSYILGQ